ncbi:MAG TPA: Fic family protein [Casimicrobiaceae bacterium]
MRSISRWLDGVAKVAELAKQGAFPSVLAAACASFGFVFVHPFLDGNGRLHRFLLHHLLRLGGFTPRRLVVPVSVVMQSNAAQYAEVLRQYSAPRTAKLTYTLVNEYDPITVTPPQPRYLYAYFDATLLCEFVGACISQAIDRELPLELEYLRSYDRALEQVRQWLDAPQTELDRLLRYIAQNDGKLSNNERGQFPLLDDGAVNRVEGVVRTAFKDYWALQSKGNGDTSATGRR